MVNLKIVANNTQINLFLDMSGMFKVDSSKPVVKSSIGGKKSTKPKRAGLGGTKKVASNVNFEKLEQESTESLKN